MTTPLFPDIDLSRFAESPVQNGAAGLPPGTPAGVMAGLNASFLALLANFSPSDLGVCVLDEKLQVSLAIPDWATYSYFESLASPSIDAASSTSVTLLTVPQDERWHLDQVRATRASGDNTALSFCLVYPAGYFAGDARNVFIRAGSPGSILFWPDPGNGQSVDQYQSPSILLEPGTILELDPGGAGVAATIFTVTMATRRTKVIRTRAP